jgi:hypothetical protein
VWALRETDMDSDREKDRWTDGEEDPPGSRDGKERGRQGKQAYVVPPVFFTLG